MNFNELLKYGENQLKKKKFVNPFDESLYILADILNSSLNYPLTILNEDITNEIQIEFKRRIKKRLKHIPIQYLSNRQDFLDLKLSVGEGVLIPRPETEELVEIISDILKDKKGIILEPCTGSAAIALSLAERLNNIFIIASEISKAALYWAKKNVGKYNSLKKKISLVRSDLLNSFKKNNNIIAIVVNPPYIETKNIINLEKQVKDHEPFVALNGGLNGFEIINKIIIQANKLLVNKSYLFMEINNNQKNIVEIILKENNFENIRIYKDFNNFDRFIVCQKK